MNLELVSQPVNRCNYLVNTLRTLWGQPKRVYPFTGLDYWTETLEWTHTNHGLRNYTILWRDSRDTNLKSKLIFSAALHVCWVHSGFS